MSGWRRISYIEPIEESIVRPSRNSQSSGREPCRGGEIGPMLLTCNEAIAKIHTNIAHLLISGLALTKQETLASEAMISLYDWIGNLV